MYIACTQPMTTISFSNKGLTIIFLIDTERLLQEIIHAYNIYILTFAI